MPALEDDELSSLLAEGRITTVTVDTNIFDEKGLQLNSPVLQAISSLKDRRFAFILSGTVAREIGRHLEAKTTTAIQSTSKAIGLALNAFETEHPTRDELLAQISGGRSPEEAAKQRLNAYIGSTGCEVIDDTALVETATIYNAYFEGRAPFGTGAKKSEFPDALALSALERIATDRQVGVLVVSKDEDWRAFCAASDWLYLVRSIEQALALINAPSVVVREALISWLKRRTGPARSRICAAQ